VVAHPHRQPVVWIHGASICGVTTSHTQLKLLKLHRRAEAKSRALSGMQLRSESIREEKAAGLAPTQKSKLDIEIKPYRASALCVVRCQSLCRCAPQGPSVALLAESVC
jgi:hypothetical protein